MAGTRDKNQQPEKKEKKSGFSVGNPFKKKKNKDKSDATTPADASIAVPTVQLPPEGITKKILSIDMKNPANENFIRMLLIYREAKSESDKNAVLNYDAFRQILLTIIPSFFAWDEAQKQMALKPNLAVELVNASIMKSDLDNVKEIFKNIPIQQALVHADRKLYYTQEEISDLCNRITAVREKLNKIEKLAIGAKREKIKLSLQFDTAQKINVDEIKPTPRYSDDDFDDIDTHSTTSPTSEAPAVHPELAARLQDVKNLHTTTPTGTPRTDVKTPRTEAAAATPPAPSKPLPSLPPLSARKVETKAATATSPTLTGTNPVAAVAPPPPADLPPPLPPVQRPPVTTAPPAPTDLPPPLPPIAASAAVITSPAPTLAPVVTASPTVVAAPEKKDTNTGPAIVASMPPAPPAPPAPSSAGAPKLKAATITSPAQSGPASADSTPPKKAAPLPSYEDELNARVKRRADDLIQAQAEAEKLTEKTQESKSTGSEDDTAMQIIQAAITKIKNTFKENATAEIRFVKFIEIYNTSSQATLRQKLLDHSECKEILYPVLESFIQNKKFKPDLAQNLCNAGIKLITRYTHGTSEIFGNEGIRKHLYAAPHSFIITDDVIKPLLSAIKNAVKTTAKVAQAGGELKTANTDETSSATIAQTQPVAEPAATPAPTSAPAPRVLITEETGDKAEALVEVTAVVEVTTEAINVEAPAVVQVTTEAINEVKAEATTKTKTKEKLVAPTEPLPMPTKEQIKARDEAMRRLQMVENTAKRHALCQLLGSKNFDEQISALQTIDIKQYPEDDQNTLNALIELHKHLETNKSASVTAFKAEIAEAVATLWDTKYTAEHKANLLDELHTSSKTVLAGKGPAILKSFIIAAACVVAGAVLGGIIGAVVGLNFGGVGAVPGLGIGAYFGGKLGLYVGSGMGIGAAIGLVVGSIVGKKCHSSFFQPAPVSTSMQDEAENKINDFVQAGKTIAGGA